MSDYDDFHDEAPPAGNGNQKPRGMTPPPTRQQAQAAVQATPWDRQASQALSVGAVEIASAASAAEAQGKMLLAKRFPRDEAACLAKFMSSCRRPLLAEAAFYTYEKGGNSVNGPSIRLMEEAMRCWGNCEFGLRELSRKAGESELCVQAWDYENNTISVHTFTVRHWRDTKKGGYQLTDERDIYEIGANQGARRMRARMKAVLPSWFVDAGIEQCVKTIEHGGGVQIVDRQRNMVVKFSEFGVTPDMLIKRLGHPINQTTPEELAEYVGIMTSLREGATKIGDWFGQQTGGTYTPPTSPGAAPQPTMRETETQTVMVPETTPAGNGEDKAPPQTVATETPFVFEAFLYDEFGDEAFPDPFVQSVEFAKAFVNLCAGKGEEAVATLLEYNEAGLADARTASQDAAAILDGTAAQGAPKQDIWAAVHVETVYTPKGAIWWPKWVGALLETLATHGTTGEAVETWFEANKGAFGSAPPMNRKKLDDALAAARARFAPGKQQEEAPQVSADTATESAGKGPQAADIAPDAPHYPAPPKAAQGDPGPVSGEEASRPAELSVAQKRQKWVDDTIKDINSDQFNDAASVTVIRNYGSMKSGIEKLRASGPEGVALADQLEKAFDDRIAALTAKAAQATSASAASNDGNA